MIVVYLLVILILLNPLLFVQAAIVLRFFFCVADKTFSFQNLVWIEEVRLDPLTRHDVLASKRVSPI